MTDETTKKPAAPRKRKQLPGAAVPEGVRRPQDHKQPKPEPDDSFMVEAAGRTWRIPRSAADDFELLDELAALDRDQDMIAMPGVLRRLIGDQWRDAMDAIRDPDTKRVTYEAAASLILDLVRGINPNS